MILVKHKHYTQSGPINVGVKYSSVASKWASLKYDEISSGSDFLEKIKLIPIQNVEKIQSVQKDQLYQSIYDLLNAFHDGTYEAYRKFRTPIPASFNSEILALDKDYIDKNLKKPGEILPNDSESIFKILWERINDGRPISLTNIWNGVNLDQAYVRVDTSTNLPLDLFTYARNNDNIGAVHPKPSFTFDVTPASILKTGKLTYATISLVIKHTVNDPNYAMYIRYYWDEKSSKWIPWDYVSAFSNRRDCEILW